MTRSMFEISGARLLLAATLGVGLATSASAGGAEDDLQAVKKAVRATSESQARPPAEDPGGAAADTKPQPRAKGEPMWFRVRVVEKASKRARVSVNLPIGLVRAMGDEWPLPSYHGCHKHERCGMTIGAVLRALDSGQSLVEIEDDEASVRVWVDWPAPASPGGDREWHRRATPEGRYTSEVTEPQGGGLRERHLLFRPTGVRTRRSP